MTRDEIKAVLTEAGVTDESKIKIATDKVLNEHNAELTEAKKVDMSQYVPKSDFDTLNSKLTEAQEGLGKFKDYDSLVKFKADTEASQVREKKLGAIEGMLKSGNCNPKVVNLLARSVDLSRIEFDDKGKLKDADKLMETLKSDNPDLFTLVENKGATPANAPAENPSPSHYTAEQLNSMSEEQINSQWAGIKKSLKENAGR